MSDKFGFTYQDLEIFFHLPDLGDHIQKHISIFGNFYEMEMLSDMQARVLALGVLGNAIAYDVGANIGNHTIFFAKVMGLDTIALEPSPRTYKVLLQNIALNHVEESVQALRIGAGSQIGSAKILERDATNWGMNQLCLDSEGDIEVKRIDEIAHSGPIVLMKIDVEGMELDVLRGAVQILRSDHPLLYIEAAEESQRLNIVEFLSEFGYSIAQRFNATPTYLFMHQQKHAACLEVKMPKLNTESSVLRIRRWLSHEFKKIKGMAC